MRLADILRAVVRLADNARISTKLMAAPALAIMALTLLFTTSFNGLRVETEGQKNLIRISRDWIEPLTATRAVARMLQADMFRLTAFGLMGEEPSKLEALATTIAKEDQRLQDLMRDLPGMADSPGIRAEMLASYAQYRRVSRNAATNFLKNPGWGATTARNAAVVLDSVIAATNRLRSAGINKMMAENQRLACQNVRLRRNLFVVMAIGSLSVLIINMLVGWRISAPLRQLTAAMARLADRHYDQEIPASLQKDEVGCMARAVQVFKRAMMTADAVAAEQRATKTLLDTVLMNLPIPVIVKDAQTLRYVLVNPAAASFWRVSAEFWTGRTVDEVVPPCEAQIIAAGDRAALSAGGLTIERDLHFFLGSPDTRIADYTRMVVPSEDGQPRYLIAVVTDFTEHRKSEQRLAHMAHYDSLTELPNRVLFGERLAEALREARRQATPIAVLTIDIDRFKEVNDTLGHAAGDVLLRIVTSRLRRCLRAGDTLARLGGDEFAVIQSAVKSPADTELLAMRLIACTREVFDLGGQRVYIGLSVGCALSDERAEATELVQRADLALNDAKQAGRGGFRFFTAQLSERLHERCTMEQDLRDALESGQLSLHYQPSVALNTGQIVGAEALMRWRHPVRGSIPPSTFIPLAEEAGLIEPLGLWLLDEACREAASWAVPIRIAVNVSPVQFRTPDFVAQVRQALKRSHLAPARLELEITEGVLIRDAAETLAILRDLRDLGVRVVLDDFGTGYASLAYLQTFSFDKLKIDQSFVKNMETDPTALAIMRAVVGLSDSLNMTTTAEGIEEETQADLLRILGCSEAQGYFFWRPMPASALRAVLAKVAALALGLVVG